MNRISFLVLTPLADHLWQSTVFAAGVWLITLLLKKSPARVRYGLRLTASVKFLLPFSLFVSLGGLLPRAKEALPRAQISLYASIYTSGDAISQPLAGFRPTSGSVRVVHEDSWGYLTLIFLVWLVGAAVAASVWYLRGRQISRIRCRAIEAPSGREAMMMRRVGPGSAIPLLLTEEHVEPAIVGILRPVLLWPVLLSKRLDDGQMEAILRHEMLHVSRRDNMTMAVHMLVETLFWFHPMVWWMERRLIEERERACDEAVMEAGTDAKIYAGSILQACRFCLELPMPGTAGISGAELNGRIRSIMNFQTANLSYLAKILLSASTLLAVAVPVMYGIVRATPFYGQILHSQGPMPSFEVATIKPWSPPRPAPSVVGSAPGERPRVALVAPVGPLKRVTSRPHFIGQVSLLIMSAYGLPYSAEKNRVIGGPEWMRSQSDRYEISAKIDDSMFATMQKMSPVDQQRQVSLMQQSLLQSRFGMKAHIERRELPIYALVPAKDGPRLTEAAADDTNQLSYVPDAQGAVLTAKAISLQEFTQAPFLGGVDRIVVDQTGLHGKYTFVLKWNSRMGKLAPDEPGEIGNEYPDIFTAVREQLGLRLVPTKGPVDVLVIDHIDRPTEN
ncbi:MAG TPA: M56 family metallopeptidase [Edaphobacter sp.]|nr:M56 family metallopeptidase [Edaphobacter sp.]